MKWLSGGAGTILLVGMVVIWYQTNQPYWAFSHELSTLKSEKDIRGWFGEPAHIFLAGNESYYVDGYSFEKRSIGHKALIFFPRLEQFPLNDIVLYVYIDDSGDIEHFFIGGS